MKPRHTSITSAGCVRLCLASSAVLVGSIMAAARGQAQAGSPPRPIQTPLSTELPAGPAVQQSVTLGGSSTVNTVNTQINIQGAYAGSIVERNGPEGTLALTMADAIQRALHFNLGKIEAGTSSQQADAQRASYRSALLPTVSANLSENAAKIDLAVEGFNSSLFGNVTSFSFPVTAGPFHYYDARASLQQNVFDLTAIHNYQSAVRSVEASRSNERQARQEVVFAVVGSYLQVLSTVALIERQLTEVRYAEASYKQAQAQADAGTKAPIEANRTLVELQTEQQRLRSQQGDLQKQKYRLARIIGLPLDVDIRPAQHLEALPAERVSVEDLVQQSFAQRQDLKAYSVRVLAAQEARKAATAQHLPSATVSGFYGVEGVNPNRGNGVFQASASMSVPLFDGGRIHADVLQADAAIKQRSAELDNQRGSVELEVRSAYVDLTIAEDQIQTAESNHKLALLNVQQSQDRFAVGVANSVEVVNSQEALATADRDYVQSLFAQNVARVALAHAIGRAEEDLPNLFKGQTP